MPKKESDFGKGLVYNLVLFANHFSNEQATQLYKCAFLIKQTKEVRDKIIDPNNSDPKYNYGKDMEFAIFWWNKIVPNYDNDPVKALNSWITLWANGASDHLYEIEVPAKWKGKQIGKLVKRLQDKGLEMGHGFRINKTYTMDDFQELQNLTKQIALLIDKELGVEVIKATWE